ELLSRDGILVVPGAYDALTARMIEKVGFDAVYMTGGGTVNSLTGLPDNGLITLTEMAMNARYIAEVTSIPVISDADTGYGNAVNVMRTIWEFEKAGVAGIHIEDQVAPKRCGHLEGKEVVSTEEMVGKIRAARAARNDPDFVIIARVDARAVLGFDEGVRRGRTYLEAGADVIFPEALENEEEFREYAKAVKGPLFANMTEFGKSPYLSTHQFEEMGYKIVIFPVTALRMALKAVWEYLTILKEKGTQKDLVDRMFTRKELYELIDYDSFNAYERDFVS
ncbi:MAG: methylisocitrate lyase, partial [Desulfobacteraceae bacterium]|nr:methylisocitrate lyase [Desulfobacteraceae bacterium]